MKRWKDGQLTRQEEEELCELYLKLNPKRLELHELLEAKEEEKRGWFWRARQITITEPVCWKCGEVLKRITRIKSKLTGDYDVSVGQCPNCKETFEINWW